MKFRNNTIYSAIWRLDGLVRRFFFGSSPFRDHLSSGQADTQQHIEWLSQVALSQVILLKSSAVFCYDRMVASHYRKAWKRTRHWQKWTCDWPTSDRSVNTALISASKEMWTTSISGQNKASVKVNYKHGILCNFKTVLETGLHVSLWRPWTVAQIV